MGEDRLASRRLHLFGHPVPGIEGRVGPLQHEDPRLRTSTNPAPHGVDPAAQALHERVRLCRSPTGRADQPDATDHVVEAGRVEGDNLRVTPDDVERLLDGTRWHGADPAEILRQNQIGIDGPDPGVVQGRWTPPRQPGH